MKKLRVGVIYGGRSGEHEVSVASAASVIKHLDRKKYEAVPIRIDKDGRWALSEKAPTLISASEVLEQVKLQAARPTRGREAHIVAYPTEETVMTIERRGSSDGGHDDAHTAVVAGLGLDVVFPALHGPYGEDGTIQGLLELANVPYVGAGVLGSAVGMDKAVMKNLFAFHRLPIVKHLVTLRRAWERDPDGFHAQVAKELKFPVFVKPANLGSSVGISKATDTASLAAAIALAADFDRKVVVEAAVPNAREIEVAVLGNDEPEASVPGEIIPSREFYDYAAKYLDEKGSELVIPAPLTPEQTREIRGLAIEAFRAVEGAGLARVDFLMDGKKGKVFLNEVNTLPGFTTISMYPKLWEASGLVYTALIDRLLTLAIERHAEKQQLRTSVT